MMRVVRVLQVRIVMVASQSNRGVANFGRMMLLSKRGLSMNDGLEAVVLVSGVLHGAHVTVGFHEGVAALDNVTVALLVLALHVTGVPIIDVVGKVVVRVSVGVVFVTIVKQLVGVVVGIVVFQWQ